MTEALAVIVAGVILGGWLALLYAVERRKP